MSEIEQWRRYSATVKIRRGDGWTVKPEAEEIDGRRMLFEPGWLMDSGRYAGEWTMIPEEWIALGWIASGDLVDVVEIGREMAVLMWIPVISTKAAILLVLILFVGSIGHELFKDWLGRRGGPKP